VTPATGNDDAAKIARSFDDGGQSGAADFGRHGVEDWFCLVFFWAMCMLVFLQFFTRYALNDSASWTEEIARYLLIFVVFIGSAMCVRLDHHIQVDLLYRWLPVGVARAMALVVDVLRIAFFGAMVVLTVQMMLKMENYQMTIIDLPMNIVYGVCLLGFAMMTVRSIWVMRVHLKRGYSVLERPESTMEDR